MKLKKNKTKGKTEIETTIVIIRPSQKPLKPP